MQEALPGTGTKVRRGMMQADLETTFTAWNERGWYTGNQHRALRGSLRTAAKAIDRLANEHGKESQCASRCLELHDRLFSLEERIGAPPTTATGEPTPAASKDPFDELVGSISD